MTTALTKEQVNYIEHEVQLRLHDSKFQNLDEAIDRPDSSIKHLDNKCMLMFSVIWVLYGFHLFLAISIIKFFGVWDSNSLIKRRISIYSRIQSTCL